VKRSLITNVDNMMKLVFSLLTLRQNKFSEALVNTTQFTNIRPSWERLIRGKHFSSVDLFVSDGEKQFYNLDTWSGLASSISRIQAGSFSSRTGAARRPGTWIWLKSGSLKSYAFLKGNFPSHFHAAGNFGLGTLCSAKVWSTLGRCGSDVVSVGSVGQL
jgi:hypothetical protein